MKELTDKQREKQLHDWAYVWRIVRWWGTGGPKPRSGDNLVKFKRPTPPAAKTGEGR